MSPGSVKELFFVNIVPYCIYFRDIAKMVSKPLVSCEAVLKKSKTSRERAAKSPSTVKNTVLEPKCIHFPDRPGSFRIVPDPGKVGHDLLLRAYLPRAGGQDDGS